nr:hypothetical protein [Nakamurella aerolata]
MHGTVSTPESNFSRLAPALRASGRCAYAVLYGAMLGWGGVGDIDASADQVAAFVGAVRRASGARQVDVIAFSQGALVLRNALQRKLNPADVRLAVLLAPNYHGTSVNLASRAPAALCPACGQQATGSPLLRRLADGGELAPGVRYAALSTADDAWVLPVSGQAPVGPADRVRAEVLQQRCPGLSVAHENLPGQPTAVEWTLGTLRNGGVPPEQLPCR